jgi:hypothetical protein
LDLEVQVRRFAEDIRLQAQRIRERRAFFARFLSRGQRGKVISSLQGRRGLA